jgi:hypothetical protein
MKFLPLVPCLVSPSIAVALVRCSCYEPTWLTASEYQVLDTIWLVYVHARRAAGLIFYFHLIYLRLQAHVIISKLSIKLWGSLNIPRIIPNNYSANLIFVMHLCIHSFFNAETSRNSFFRRKMLQFAVDFSLIQFNVKSMNIY